ncbi:Uncharacterised protein [Halioglobus japonicus]|nr:Uncharacterised protein [Halioglobus japonicus]
MTKESTLAETQSLAEAVSQDVARLVNHLRCSEAPDDALEETTRHIQQAIETLKPWLQQGEGWSTVSIGTEMSDLVWRDDDITSVMPYSPISGRRNPIALPIKLWKHGPDEVRGEAIFSPTYAGPPNSVHGGIIAAVFDEILAMANVVSGRAGFTGTLTIKYHDKTPLNTPIELRGVNVRQDGRKQLSRGEMLVDGKVTATAEGLFICAASTDS